jgi:hypothetical protein
VLIVGLIRVLLLVEVRSAHRALQLLGSGIGLYVVSDLIYGWLSCTPPTLVAGTSMRCG